ncbi:hypothetical protein T265_01978 [Opisthorchis viverrini]|uniref:Reverse transcriptase domain-containing protein n=1 Tax=Opisthorchis viverrini TaxID=6198 RepID=A0A075AIM5_OPIVI|nr:hypothetical protein T265_01978 [Opisthorchis viverrini]KER31894.1 hypothetical protein T265_01978 [Opisthorchis viverrini]
MLVFHDCIPRKSLKRQIVKSLRKDRELWWTSKAREMENAFATGNSRVLYQLIRSTGPRKATVSETINEKDGSSIHWQKRRLERWAEHSEEQFSWPPAIQPVEIVHTGKWNVNLDHPSEGEIRYEVAALKREKAPGPDGLYPALFKEGRNSLVTHLTKLIGTMWDEEQVPSEWGMSTVIPIFKKGTRTLCENHRDISLDEEVECEDILMYLSISPEVDNPDDLSGGEDQGELLSSGAGVKKRADSPSGRSSEPPNKQMKRKEQCNAPVAPTININLPGSHTDELLVRRHHI